MLILPAIDLADGKCVRLLQGDMKKQTVFSDDPAAMAIQWQDQGAEMLHVVDLDGAMGGQSKNLEAIKKIVTAIQIPVELGGGLRTRDDVAQVLEMGLHRAIMGTSALSNRPEVERCLAEFGEKIIIGIDARDGKVAVEGWMETSNITAIDLALQMQKLGVQRIIFTDIATDGMLAGPNVESLQHMAQAVDMGVIASGGITTLDDVRKVRLLQSDGITGCIIGRALYSGTINLPEAISTARG